MNDCESCCIRRAHAYVTWEDDETFYVCFECASAGYDAGGKVDIREAISQLRHRGAVASGVGD
jgi:hypothetical protein